jgi:hypothetical protein
MEKLVALCDKCKCCLADTTHCWECHVTKSIAELCGDDLCEAKVEDYKQREKMMNIKRLARLGQYDISN